MYTFVITHAQTHARAHAHVHTHVTHTHTHPLAIFLPPALSLKHTRILSLYLSLSFSHVQNYISRKSITRTGRGGGLGSRPKKMYG